MCNTYVSHIYIQPSTSGVLFFLSNCCQFLYFWTSQESTFVLVRGISYMPDWALWLFTFLFSLFLRPRLLGYAAAVLYCCFTATLLLLYCCFTSAVLLLYFCFATADMPCVTSG